MSDKYSELVLAATKRFKMKRDKVQSSRPKVVPTQEVLDEDSDASDANDASDAKEAKDDSDDCEEEVDPVEQAGDVKKDKIYRVSLLELERRQKYRRTAPIINFLKDAALKNKVTVQELIGANGLSRW